MGIRDVECPVHWLVMPLIAVVRSPFPHRHIKVIFPCPFRNRMVGRGLAFLAGRLTLAWRLFISLKWDSHEIFQKQVLLGVHPRSDLADVRFLKSTSGRWSSQSALLSCAMRDVWSRIRDPSIGPLCGRALLFMAQKRLGGVNKVRVVRHDRS